MLIGGKLTKYDGTYALSIKILPLDRYRRVLIKAMIGRGLKLGNR
jgi:hypothetical protein